MDNFDLGEALRKYRKDENLTQQEMAKKLNMSRPAYDRLEDGVVKPDYEQAIKLQKELNLPGPVPPILAPPPPKWYQSKMWRWIKPVIFAYLACDLAVTVEFSQYVDGKQIIQEDLPIVGFIILSGIYCAIYWWNWPPEWPFKKEVNNFKTK